jgi:16S rRNA (uracil1498-N3)-methyltransferase
MIIEKATELGVDEIIPLKTDRTEIKLTDSRQAKKQLRYQTIAINASKQAKRAIVPVIHPIADFTYALDHLTKTTAAIIPSLMENTENLFSAFKKIQSPEAISFLIGPEGDFTPQEYAQAQQKGCLPVTLGKTILKVETAALCALSGANLFFRT